MKRLLFILFMLIAFPAYSATYYIDYTGGDDANHGTSKEAPWKYAPGMSGFTGSYTHAPGVIMIFKGGETWPLNGNPWEVIGSGEEGAIDTYTADETWYSGSSFTQPTIDGGGTIPQNNGVINIDGGKHHLHLNNLRVINAGVEGEYNDNRAIDITYNYGNIEISYCTITPYNKHGIVFLPNWTNFTADVPNGLHFHHNDVSHCSNMIEGGGGEPPTYTYRYTINIHDNKFHDNHSELMNTDHGDGIHIWNNYTDDPNGYRAKYYTGKIYNNHWYGDFSGADTVTSNTGQIYVEQSASDLDIYNNVLSFDNTTEPRNDYLFSPGMMVIGRGERIRIYNNTFTGNKLYENDRGAKTALYVNEGNDINIEGNIFDKMTAVTVSVIEGATNVHMDYNVYSEPLEQYGGSGDGAFYNSLANWQAYLQTQPGFTGNEAHALDAAIQFNDVTIFPQDLRLSQDSPAVDAFPTVDAPTTVFDYDLNYAMRPQGSAWDMGAYEYGGQAPPVTSSIYTYGGSLVKYNNILIGEPR